MKEFSVITNKGEVEHITPIDPETIRIQFIAETDFETIGIFTDDDNMKTAITAVNILTNCEVISIKRR